MNPENKEPASAPTLRVPMLHLPTRPFKRSHKHKPGQLPPLHSLEWEATVLRRLLAEPRNKALRYTRTRNFDANLAIGVERVALACAYAGWEIGQIFSFFDDVFAPYPDTLARFDPGHIGWCVEAAANKLARQMGIE
ncbi:MAG: hypothetical protein IAE66_10930 [Xanthomonadaceae bacterium]|nr:hypothetical protein [Xanthomonadaceae bacterium]